MAREILVYGHGDKSEDGFETEEDLIHYLEGGIFDDEDGRYRYSQTKTADVIVLTRDGLALGHFDIDDAVPPTKEDHDAYPRVRKVYLVRKSVRYEKPVRLSDFDISRYQFGRHIDEHQFEEILRAAGGTFEVLR